MQESEPIALIDMDGTVANYVKAMRAALAPLYAPSETRPPDGLEETTWMRARQDIVKRQPGFWRDLETLPLGLEVVALLQELQFSLMVLTKGPARAPGAWTEKVQWCREHLPNVPITITEDKGLTYGKILFDDYPPYVERWLQWRPRGFVIMLAHPWNVDFKSPNVFRLQSAEQLPELRERLQKIYDR